METITLAQAVKRFFGSCTYADWAAMKDQRPAYRRMLEKELGVKILDPEEDHCSK